MRLAVKARQQRIVLIRVYEHVRPPVYLPRCLASLPVYSTQQLLALCSRGVVAKDADALHLTTQREIHKRVHLVCTVRDRNLHKSLADKKGVTVGGNQSSQVPRPDAADQCRYSGANAGPQTVRNSEKSEPWYIYCICTLYVLYVYRPTRSGGADAGITLFIIYMFNCACC